MSTAATQLVALLDSLDESNQFCTWGQRPPVLPGLEVEGAGEMGLPVRAADAKRLIGQASQAPYGRGEATIVDTDVRRVWQIQPRSLKIGNPQWNRLVHEIVEEVKEQFAITRPVDAKLYKLLIYEKRQLLQAAPGHGKARRHVRHAGGLSAVPAQGRRIGCRARRPNADR